MLHHKRRTDHNQASIVNALQRMGWHITDLSAVGKGCPDLLVTKAGKGYLCEIKSADRKPRFTRVQAGYYLQQSMPIYVLTGLNDVILFEKGELKQHNALK